MGDRRVDGRKEVMIGNQAIARGLVEAGLEIAAAYPGTPSSEILPGIVYFKNMEGLKIHTEWSSNELCAFEVAFGAAAYGGARAACFMKQVGLNVAFPALLRAREKVLEGGFVIVSCDDPGPQSSQTEQDTRLIATLFGIPVFDPASPEEAADVAYYALNWSFKNKVPVIVRSTHRVSHARQSIDLHTPGTRTVTLREGVCAGQGRKLGIVASGMSYSLVQDVIEELGAANDASVYKVLRVYPHPEDLGEFVESMDKVLVIEETDMVVEALIGNRRKVMGRADGTVPSAGEITYDLVRDILSRLLQGQGETKIFIPDRNIEKALSDIMVKPRPPKLCPGCSHRAAFFAMQYIWPDAIYPGDIGCYTLGTEQGAVDTFVDMGSGVTLAEGFYDAFDQDGKLVPLLASVGDSTFFHACLAPLYDAVKNHKRFILVIMDNSTTAMTGMQPTPQTGITVDGIATRSVAIEDIVSGLGVKFLRVVDPYDVPLTIGTIRDAFSYLQGDDMLPAVIITRRECLLLAKGKAKDAAAYPARLEQDCVGCQSCFTTFDCPAMSFDPDLKKVRIDDSICINCGICYYACPVQPEGKDLKKYKSSGKASSK